MKAQLNGLVLTTIPNMQVTYGTKTPYAQRVFVNSESVSIMACFNLDGFVESSIDIHKETLDADKFIEYFRTFVFPLLGNYEEGGRNSVVVLDNWSGHRKVEEELQDVCDCCGSILLFLPPYQPWCNPIGEHSLSLSCWMLCLTCMSMFILIMSSSSIIIIIITVVAVICI